MSHYVSGRQFIFEERPRWIFLGLLVVMLIGMLIGILLGLIISLAGIYLFEAALVGLAIFILYDAYDLTFLKKSGAADKTGFALMVMLCTALLIIFMAAIRYSAIALGLWKRCLIFSLVGIALALIAYVYARLCCQEDERKHHLGPCSPEGDELESVEFPGEKIGYWESWSRFLSWILSGQWWYDINDWSIPADEDCCSRDKVVVHNRSLKLIKVCLYSSRDVVCWVPVGGIAGSCVGFIRAGEKRAFTLPRPWRQKAESNDQFRLKVFMPGLLDKELAYYPVAKRGQYFAFVDVEGVVRRSRFLSSSLAPFALPPLPSNTESSEEELGKTGVGDSKFESLTGLMRKRSNSLQLLSQSPGPDEVAGSSRKAAPDEIVIRNRSSHDVRAMLWPSLMKSCVYSVGPAAKELTYLTVSRPGPRRAARCRDTTDYRSLASDAGEAKAFYAQVQELQVQPGAMASDGAVLPKMGRQIHVRDGTAKAVSVGILISNTFWPVIRQCLAQHPGDSKLVEKSCRLLKHSMRCVPDLFKPNVPDVARTLVTAFQQHQHSSYLYSAEILANTYASDPEIVPVLTELFNQLSGIGLQCLIASESKLEEITELVEDFFGMFERYLRFAPTIVINAPTLLPTLRLWSVVIFVQQKEAVEAVIAFIESVFSHIAETKKVGRRFVDEQKASIGQMLQPHAMQVAPGFVEAVFKLIAVVPTKYVQDCIPSILEGVRSAFPQEFANWLEAGLGHLPPSVGSKAELQKFGEQILRGDDAQVYEAIQERGF
ncbi:Tnpo3 [Symbiodinium sp. CCMP2592]|nr:Tnpo3 [Symbiodinium sp. CCMP2592]